MELIIPAAGLSTRFPNMKPKYLLSDDAGVVMIKNAVGKLIEKYPAHIAILKEHDEKYQASQTLRSLFGDKINIIVLDSPTKGPAETVYKIIQSAGISGSFFIKDCDNYWTADAIEEENAVWTGCLKDNPYMTNVAAKSYVVANNQSIITSIIEKQVVSEDFVAGGYQFISAKEYCEEYEYVSKTVNGELFVSGIIDSMLAKGTIFIRRTVSNFVDVGTLKDWEDYNKHFVKVK
jgi:hypothetical protein